MNALLGSTHSLLTCETSVVWDSSHACEMCGAIWELMEYGFTL